MSLIGMNGREILNALDSSIDFFFSAGGSWGFY